MAKDNEPKIDLKKPAATGEDQTAKIPKPLKPSAPGEEDKVVLNSGTDSAIRPSDATRMAPAVVPPAQAEKTISMEKTDPSATDDSTQKTVKPPAPSAAGKAKTIKLKPLTTNQDSDNQEETVSMERDAAMLNMAPSLGGSAPKPSAAPPADAGIDDEATIKIEKPKAAKPNHPVPNIPGAKETIKLRPSNTTPPPTPAPSPGDDESQETVAMSKKTIRLIPKKPGADTADDSTQKTAKPSAPTVKLTDSKGPAPGAPAAPASAPTVSAPSAGAPPPAAPKPSAPTVKLPEPKAPAPAGKTASGSKKTLKLKSSGATGTSSAAAPPAGGPGGAPPAGKKDLPPKAAAPKAPKDSAKGDNPGVVMTIAAVLTLLLMAYITWITIGSWAEGLMDLTDNANVPMLSGETQPPR